jgi:hypothetical protein
MISNPDIDFYPALMSEEIHCKKRFDLNIENLLFYKENKKTYKIRCPFKLGMLN